MTQVEKNKKNKRKSKGVSLQGGGMTMSILELLQHIVNEPAPRLTPEGRFPKEAEEFVDSCLLKDPDARSTPKDLLVGPPCDLLYVRRSCEHHVTETLLDRTCPDVEVRPRGMGVDILNSVSLVFCPASKHIEYLRRFHHKPLLAPSMHARPGRVWRLHIPAMSRRSSTAAAHANPAKPHLPRLRRRCNIDQSGAIGSTEYALDTTHDGRRGRARRHRRSLRVVYYSVSYDDSDSLLSLHISG